VEQNVNISSGLSKLLMLNFLFQLYFQQTSHTEKLKWGSAPKTIGNRWSNSQIIYMLKPFNFINVRRHLLSYSFIDQFETTPTFILQHVPSCTSY